MAVLGEKWSKAQGRSPNDERKGVMARLKKMREKGSYLGEKEEMYQLTLPNP